MIFLRKSTKEILLKFVFLLLLISFSYGYNFFSSLEKNHPDAEFRELSEATMSDNTVFPKSEFQIFFLDVGQADSILIQNNGLYALIDAGNNLDGDGLVSFLHQLGVSHFHYVIGTHAHEDHIGGMDNIINNFSIDHFYMPSVLTTTKTFEEVLDALSTKRILFETPDIDSTFTMADTKFHVLFIGDDKQDLNNTSIVLKVEYKNTSFLLMGDATNEVERTILDKDLESDLLKVGHHGSQYSSSAVFLKKVNPQYAVISVGKDNEYGHPKQVVLDKLERLGTQVYRTDQLGTIVVSSDGNEIYFDTYQTSINKEESS